MAFSPPAIAQGGVSRLTYDLDNGAAVEATSVSLSDSLPADVVLADPPDAQTSCGGTLTAAAGGDMIAFTGGTLGAGASCTLAVDVTSALAGPYPNETESVTSSLGTSTAAEATLTVDPAEAPGFAKVFSPARVAPGGISRLTFTIDNAANAIAVGSLAFTDDFPDGMTVAAIPNGSTACGGTFAPVASAASLAFTGGSVAAGETCTLAVDVQALPVGALENLSDTLTSDLPVATSGAGATLTVNEVPLSVSMAFSPPVIRAGEVSRLTYTLGNGAAVEATSVSLSDSLPADVVLADPPDAQTTCSGGTLVAAAGGDTIAFTGGALGAGASCTIAVDVTSALVGSYPNGTESVTSSLGSSTPVEATLRVTGAPPGFTKAFSPARVVPFEISRLTFTIDNSASSVAVGGLAFTDAFPNGLDVAAVNPNAETSCGGTLAVEGDDDRLTFTGGSVAAGATCTIAIDVQAAPVGALENVSFELTSDLPFTTPGAAATLTVNEDPLTVSMAFEPPAIVQGEVSRLTYTLDNGAAFEARAVSLFDRLPAAVAVAAPSGAQTTCIGGTLTAAVGGDTIAFTGEELFAGASCTIAVNVTSTVPGSYRNETESVTSSLGTSTAAEATLTVTAAPPGFAKAFSSARVDPGGISRLTFTIDNAANLIAVGSLAFTDDFPDGMTVAATPNAETGCGGTFAPAASATSLAFTGGSVAAGQTCTIAVDVQALRAGALENLSDTLTSDLPVATSGARATLTVNEVPLSVLMAFEPPVIGAGGVSRLTYTLDNGAAVEATSVSLSDRLPADVVLAAPSDAQTTCSGGTLVAAAGGDTIAFTGGGLGAGASCTIAVDVTSVLAGSYPNDTESVTSSLGTGTPAEATLRVDAAGAPGFARVFVPDSVRQGGETQIVFTVDNTANLIDLGELAFTDAFPDGLIVADAPNATTACGGTFSPAAGAATLAFTGGVLAAGATCEIRVTVRAIAAGTLTGPAVTLTSNLAPATAAEARLDVTPAGAPGFARVFAPDSVRQGGETQIVFTVDNTANLIDLGELAFTDAFPDGLVVADAPSAENSCEGTFDPVAGAATLAFADGALAAGAACEIRVTVRAIGAGTLTGPAVTLRSNVAPATAAEATLTVDPAEAPGFAKAFSPARVAPGGISRLTFMIDNAANLIEVGSLAFTDAFPDGLVVADPPNAETGCGGTFAPAASATSLAFTGGSVASGEVCTIAVDLQALRAGGLENTSGTLVSDLPVTTPGAGATLAVDEAPLSVSMAFSPPAIVQGEVSRLTYTLDNGAAVEATLVALSDRLPAAVAVADPPDAQTTCSGGTLTAAAGSRAIAYSEGALAAGASCTIAVDMTSATVGSYPNNLQTVTSSLGASAAVSARLDVTPAAAPGFAKAFSPSRVDPGGISRLTFTIDNAANLVAVGGLAFTDAFPDGLIVAATPNGSTSCGGTFAPTASAASLAFTGGSVASGEACTIAVDVQARRAGTLENLSDTLTSDLPVAASGARATLTVNEIPLSVSMAFEPPVIRAGGVSRLTHTLRNGAAVEATSVSLSDSLPPDVALADPPDAQTTCTGGRLTAAAGDEAIAYSDGALAAGASCTIAVDVTSTLAGSHPNDTQSVTSSLGTSTPAEARLTVDAAGAPGFARVFAPDSVRQGEETQIVFTVDNGANLIDLVELAFTDAFPDGLVVADTPNATTACGGTFSPVAGASTLAFADGALAAGATCEIRVTLRAIAPGRLIVPAVTLTSNVAPAIAAEARLDVTPAAAPGFAKAFSPARVAPGGISRLTFTIDNTANAIAVGSLAFTDAFPDGLVAADAPNAETGCGGTFAPAASATSLAFTGGSVASGEVCTIAVDLQARRPGTLENLSGALTSDLPVTTSGARATLTVDAAPLTVSMAFSPRAIDQGGVSRLTHTLRNGAAVEATSVALSDMLPAAVAVADPSDAQTTCIGGTLTAAAGTREIAYSGGALGAGATCTIAVDVTSALVGSYLNDTQSVTSSLGTSTVAEATLTVDPAAAPGFAKAFSPARVAPGVISRLTFTIDNTANAIDLRELAFTDAFPDGLVAADPPNAETGCGGTFAPAASATALAFSGGSVAAGEVCTIAVDLQARRPGTLENLSGALTSDLPVTTSGARATLTVDAAPLTVSMAFSPRAIDQGGVSRLTHTLRNGAAVEATSVALSDMLPAAVAVADPSDAQTTCIGGTLTAAAGTREIAYSGGALGAGATCTIAVDVTSALVGSYLNDTQSVTSSLGTSTVAEATLTVDPAAAPGFAKAFFPARVGPGGLSRLTFTIDNAANLIDLRELAFTDVFPDGLVAADSPNAETGCGGTFAPVASAAALAFTGGSVAAGQTCRLSVDVQALRAGTLENLSGALASDLPVTTPGATATLTVDAAPLSVSMAFSPPAIDQGGVSRLTHTLSNGAAVEATGVALSDRLPADVVVADPPDAQTTCTGGRLTAAAGGDTIAYSDGALAAGASCTIAVDVTSALAGPYPNGTESVTSSLGTSTAAEATLTVDPAEAPGFAKAFSPARVDPGGISRLTFAIDNAANLIAVGSLAFTDVFPDGLVVADPPNAETSCGGTFAPAASAASLAFSGGSVASGEACTIAVDVQALRPGALENLSGVLASDLPVTTPGAGATLTVDEDPLSVSMAFEPPAIVQGEVSRLTYTLDNGAAVEATSVALSDRLPAAVAVADPPDAQTTCAGGTLAAAAGVTRSPSRAARLARAPPARSPSM